MREAEAGVLGAEPLVGAQGEKPPIGGLGEFFSDFESSETHGKVIYEVLKRTKSKAKMLEFGSSYH